MKGSTTGWALALALMSGLGLAAPALAAPAKKPAPAPAAAPARTAAADSSIAGSVGDAYAPSQQIFAALQAIHLTACAASVQRVTDYLFDRQDAKTITQPLGPDADRWPTVFTIESANSTGGGHNRFAILTIAPNCSGMYQQTIYWPTPCALVKSTMFGKFSGEHPLLRDVKVADDGPALQVYLMPAGTGCVSIKKELFH